MSDEQCFTTEFDALLADALDLRLDVAQMTRFEQFLSEPRAIDYYVDHAILHAMLRWEHTRPLDGVTDGPWLKPLPVIVSEQPAEHSISPAPGFFSTAFYGTVGFFSQEILFGMLIATVLIGLGLWIGSHIYITHDVQIADESSPHVERPVASTREPEPKIEYVGKITGMVDCRWGQGSVARGQDQSLPSPAGRGARGEGGESEIRNQKSLVALGDKFTLASGLMEITYDTGAKVILQGPVTYEVESAAGGFLSIGKLTARLDGAKPQAANHKSEILNQKFVVRTPTAIVTDLGTEFGVEVDASGTSRAHVLRGKVAIRTPVAYGGREIILTENQCSQVDAHGAIVREPEGTTKSFASTFVRRMPERDAPKSVSLAGLVTGGGEFADSSGCGIDPRSGMIAFKWFDAKVKSSGQYEPSNGGSQHIDGVFMPIGGNIPVQLDSAGHTFVFPKTCGESYGPIWACRTSSKGTLSTESRTSRSSAEGPRVLLLHANAGITFNLSTIRAGVDRSLARFQSVVVNRSPATCAADVWVLVDGQLRFHRGNDAPVAIDMPLSDSDRFLTLVSTDGGDKAYLDDIQYHDPRVVLQTDSEDGKDEFGTAAVIAPIAATSANVENIVLHLKFDETAGRIATDSSGHGNHGTLHNEATWTASGKSNGAVVLNGSKDYVLVTDTSALLTYAGGDLTLSAWVNVSSAENDGGYVISKLLDKMHACNYGLTVGKDGAWLAVQVGSLESFTAVHAASDLSTGWHHIVGVLDSSQKMSLYIDGSLAASGIYKRIGTATVTNAPLAIGTYYPYDEMGKTWGGNSSFSFGGKVDDVQIYTNALTGEHVEYLYDHPGQVTPAASMVRH